VANGSIPFAIVGLIVLFLMHLMVSFYSTLSAQMGKEIHMNTTLISIFWSSVGISLFSLVWTIGTGMVAGALPA